VEPDIPRGAREQSLLGWPVVAAPPLMPVQGSRHLATRVAQEHRPRADGGLHAGSGAIGGFLRSQWLPCWPTTVARARN